jgi:predicted transcriptional regulator of viral defense system
MKFHELLALVGKQPLFETGLLLAGEVDSNDIRRQLSRWVRAGKIRQLRRGLYIIAPPYQSVVPHPFLIANALVPGSYVSGQSALAHYGLIPEYTPRTTSVTTSHTSQWDGGFIFHHLVPHLFFGYQKIEVSRGQEAFVALPEKCLLDLAHLTPNADSTEYITQLRLQNLELLNIKRLNDFAERANKPKWKRVANQIAAWISQEENELEELP